MANFISITILPDEPVAASEFQAFLTGAEVEVVDLNLDDFLPGAPSPSPIGTHIISASDFPNSGDVYLSLKILDNSGAATADLKVKIKLSNGKIIHDKILSYQFPIEGNTSGSTDEPSKFTDGYIFLTIGSGGIGALFQNNGSSPSYQNVYDVVLDILSLEGGTTTIGNLNWEQCLHIARECAWRYYPARPPRPSKKLKKLYDFDEDSDGVIHEDQDRKEKRAHFETDVEKYYNEPEMQAQKLAKCIWAMTCAIRCEYKTTTAAKMHLRFPVDPADPDVAKRKNLDVYLTGALGTYLTVPAEYFYALGVEMPIQMDENTRFNAAVSSEPEVLLDQFKRSQENGVIGTPSINHSQAIRRLHAQNLSLKKIPEMKFPDDINYNTWNLTTIISAWSSFLGPEINDFWTPITPDDEAHSDMVIYVLAIANKHLYKAIDDGAGSVATLVLAPEADWKTWYGNAETANGGELHLDFIPSGLTLDERKTAFYLYARQFFNQPGTATSSGPTANLSNPPTFNQTGPIEAYLAQSGHILGTPFTPDQTVLDNVMGDDPCAQEWLVKKITALNAVVYLTKDLGVDAALQFSIMEGLHARGFTSVQSVESLTSDVFKEALTGTVAFDYATAIYAQAAANPSFKSAPTNPLSQVVIDCPTVSLAPNNVIEFLQKNGFYDPASIAILNVTDFENALVGTAIANCAMDIHSNAVANVMPRLTLLAKACIGPIPPEDIAQILLSKGFGDAGSIVVKGKTDFINALAGTGIEACAVVIYDSALTMVHNELKAIVAECTLGDPQKEEQTIQLLIENGFIDAAAIAAVSATDFEQALGVDGQAIAPCLITMQLVSGQTAQNQLASIAGSSCTQSSIEILNFNGFFVPSDICKMSLSDFIKSIRGRIGKGCLEKFYAAAGCNNTQTTGFSPINNGTLVNCVPPAYLSPLSPNGYLHDLLQLSAKSTCSNPFPDGATPTVAQSLAGRRAEPGGLAVSVANLETTLPLIDLVNEHLEAWVATGSPVPTADTYNTSDQSAQVLEAMPEHSTPFSGKNTLAAFDKIKDKVTSDCCSPYNQALDVSRSYLQQIGLNRFELLRHFRQDIREFIFKPDGNNPPTDFKKHRWGCPMNEELAHEYLCLSEEEADIFTDPAKFTVPVVESLCDFMQASCLEYCEFYELWQSKFIPFGDKLSIEFPSQEPCCCDDHGLMMYEEQGTPKILVQRTLTSEELRDLFHFVRLWKNMNCVPGGGYSFKELSDICQVLGFSTDKAGFLQQLAAFHKLRTVFDLNLTDGSSPAPDALGADRTHLLALWVNPQGDKYDWAVSHLLERIQLQAQTMADCTCRPPEFIKLLHDNLAPLSVLAGYQTEDKEYTWDRRPSYTLCFVEKLAAIYASPFSIGEIFMLFTAQEHLAGDDPFPLQSRTEAIEDPFELPDDNEAYSLWALRKKLLETTVSEAEVSGWTWMKIDACLRNEFGYDPGAGGVDYLQSLGKHFFPSTLQSAGYSISTLEQQYRAPLPVAITATLMWNSDQQSPFRYDDGSENLWVQLPLTDEAFIAKFSRLRQLKKEEELAVRELYFMPRVELAQFGFLFPNFIEAQESLIQEPDEAKRWAYFQGAFALTHKRCRVIAAHLAEHVAEVTGQPNSEGDALAWQLLRHLSADENRAVNNTEWELDAGAMPNQIWKPQPSNSAFAALSGLIGTGLLGEFTTDKGLVWRETRGDMESFGPEENHADAPIPTVIPRLSLMGSHRFATIRNGFALENPDGDLLGGADAYTVRWRGVLMVETSGSYVFRAGAPMPGNEIPDFKKVPDAKWMVALQKGQKRWTVLSHNMQGETAPGDCSAPISLKHGAHEIEITYIQPTTTFGSKEESCPQTTGFQLKYTGADTDDLLVTVPIDKLYLKAKDASMAENVTAFERIDTNIPASAEQFLANQYVSSIRDCRRTYLRAFAAMVFTHRFQLSAQPAVDNGRSEIGFFLSNPDSFAGESAFLNVNEWKTHKAGFNFNFLPVLDNYCPPDAINQDIRANPSPKRIQALFDWWCRISEYTRLRRETTSASTAPTWLLFNEAQENHPDEAGQLLWHLGIDFTHASLVTHFFDGSVVEAKDLENEIWAIRVWEAEKCIRKMLCGFTPKDLVNARPDLWASDGPGVIGNDNLIEFVKSGYLENGDPRRYLELKTLNDALRQRGRDALVAYLVSQGTANTTKALSELMLIDVETGVCQKASRVEESITAVQLFINRARLGLESSFPISSEFRLLLEKRMGTFHAWEKCKRRELYPENWVEFDKIAQARKSEGFRMLEDKLRQQSLSVPVSGGLVNLKTVKKPPIHKGVTILQKREMAVMNVFGTAVENFDLLGTPFAQSQPSLLSATINVKVPFWIEAAIRLKAPFVKLTAASLPSAALTYDCEHGGCCDDCCDETAITPDEYYFWLLPSTFYTNEKQKGQKAEWEWDTPEMLPTLLNWETTNMVYLVWTRVRQGEFSQMRWSSEGLEIDGAPGLSLKGRHWDSLQFEVSGGVTPVGTTTPPDAGFRYDLVTDSAIVLPSINQSAGDTSLTTNDLAAVPYFVYFEPGAPAFPTSMYAPAIAVANNLRAHCRYEEALKWYELEVLPLLEDNSWCKLATGSCCKGSMVEESEAARRSLLLHYIETLLQWGKALMKQNKPESFQQARLLFDTASKILGACPSNAQAQATDPAMVISGFKPLSMPLNPRLLCLFEQTEDCLALIHNCENARRFKNGNPNKDMRYWGDSENNCCDQSDDCCDEFWCLPESPYRFQFLLNKSLELAGMVSGLGNALLSSIEKGESEQLAALRERNGKQVLDLTLSIKEKLAREANWQVQALEKTLLMTMTRLVYYQGLIADGLISEEEDYKDFTDQSMVASAVAQAVEAATAPINLVPDTYVGPMPLVHAAGGEKLAPFLLTGAKIAHIISSIQGTRASKKATIGGWERRLQEWQHQVSILKIEVEQVTRQLLAAKLREMVALRELNNHSLQIQQTNETLDYLRDKFTNQQLYLWQQQELAALHYQMYECALQTAKQTQAAFVRERGYKRNFLDCGIWDNLHQGLLAGEKLQFNLRQMEKAYLDDNVREFELNKSISLLHHFPEALLQLKATGYCEVELPEALFDLNYPGHYMRRIKSISVTIPCVAGPYTGVHCRLTLLSSSIRTSPTLKCASGCGCSGCQKSHPHYEALPDDCRLLNEYVATEAIATSNAQKDSGLFQLDFRDERYLPFEYAGTISRWRIELDKECNFFDLQTVSDLIMDMSYTAREGGQQLRAFATDHAKGYLPGAGHKLLDVKNEMPDAWFELTQPVPIGGSLAMKFGSGMFPYLPYKHTVKVSCLEIFVELDNCESCDQLVLDIRRNEACQGCDPQVTLVKDRAWGGLYHGIFKTDWALTKANKDFGQLDFPAGLQGISRVYLLCCFEVVRTECVKEVACQCC